MVRLIAVEKNGRVTYVEDAPTACGNGHERLTPTWGQCPVATCGQMVRLWKCRADGCGEVLYDDEHVHRDQAPPSTGRGG